MTQGPIRDRAKMRSHDVMSRWPLLTAHLIAESLGATSPAGAAMIILDAANGRPNHCEWMMHTFGGNTQDAMRKTIKNRGIHKGFMADFRTALAIVKNELDTGKERVFSSWF